MVMWQCISVGSVVSGGVMWPCVTGVSSSLYVVMWLEWVLSVWSCDWSDLFSVTGVYSVWSCDYEISVFSLTFLPIRLLQRRHNFHLLEDILEATQMTESQFCDCIGPNIRAFPVSGLDISRQLRHPYYNKQLEDHLRPTSKNAVLKFIPICSQVRQMLGIEVNNLDDWSSYDVSLCQLLNLFFMSCILSIKAVNGAHQLMAQGVH